MSTDTPTPATKTAKGTSTVHMRQDVGRPGPRRQHLREPFDSKKSRVRVRVREFPSDINGPPRRGRNRCKESAIAALRFLDHLDTRGRTFAARREGPEATLGGAVAEPLDARVSGKARESDTLNPWR